VLDVNTAGQATLGLLYSNSKAICISRCNCNHT